MSLVQNTSSGLSPARNYQIDFLKLGLSVMVFFGHTIFFVSEYASGNANETQMIFHHLLGYDSVMCFFVISGFFMVSSISRRDFGSNEPGKASIIFVIDKFKKLALPFWISSSMYLFTFIIYIQTM